MPATLTPLRYPGGKTKYTDYFIEIISTNNLNQSTFVEVFAGGAGAAISLLLKGHVKALFLNDMDVAIYSFWKSIIEQPEAFIKLIKSTRINMAEWKRQKLIYDKKNTNDTLSLGFATFYLNRCNHSGILEARPIGGMKQDGDYRINSRYNKETSIKKIKKIAQYADSIELYNMDGIEFLKHLKQYHRNRKLLIYFDPPYYQKGPELYLNHFNHKNHEILRNEILRCPFPWVLSYDDHEEIINMYKKRECNLYRNSLRHTVTSNKNAEELIISKLMLPGCLKKLFDINKRDLWE